ncbi:DUF2789 domain-containing protein [Shewanella khirikhana]|uniref:DUF2789 domain-containing protein n=1 Tax=Shewanella khirikhana TaxID=1965282 RepID=UPI0030CA7DC8
MDTTPVDLGHLFEQLGLDNTEQAINEFIASHQLAAADTIWQASFWSQAQAAFLKEALEADSNWSELVDLLDTQLRK